jgi:hypothetical protein
MNFTYRHKFLQMELVAVDFVQKLYKAIYVSKTLVCETLVTPCGKAAQSTVFLVSKVCVDIKVASLCEAMTFATKLFKMPLGPKCAGVTTPAARIISV